MQTLLIMQLFPIIKKTSCKAPNLCDDKRGGHSKSTFVVEGGGGSLKSEIKRTGGEGQAYLYVRSVKKIA